MKKILATLIATAAACAAPAALAQGYLGMSIGATHVNVDCTAATDCDKTGSGGKLMLGYRFAPNLGAELSYFDFGKAEASGPGPAFGSIKARAWGVGVAYIGEVTPTWLAGARLGVARTKSELSGTIGPFTAAGSRSSAQPYFGVMMGYVVSPNLSVDVVLDYSRVKYDGQTDNVRLLSVGLTYGF